MGMTGLAGKDRLIFALDVSSRSDASRLIEELDGVVSFFKIGLELLMTGGFEDLLETLVQRKKVFVDLKLPGDIPETVRRAVAVGARRGVELLTLSAAADQDTIRAAVDGRGRSAKPRLLFVSYLSSQDRTDFARNQGAREEEFDAHVARKAKAALESGCDGLVASGGSIALLRGQHPETIIVAPGIRPSGSPADDHKRHTTPAEAIAMGADYLVVGRPIRDAADRAAAARRIIDEIDQALETRRSA
jgi:orotidine-5'-phosphate decarboxylase